jgi:sucrose-6F-phosphate phosphohydrolase
MNTIISDIDGTLLGDNEGLMAFNGYIGSFRDRVFLVYATGRSYDEFINAVEHDGLLWPDAVIASTGADIYIRKGDGYERDLNWLKAINIGGWDVGKIRAILDDFPGLQSQTARNEYKASYYMDADRQKELEATVKKLMNDNKIGAKIIASHGIYLDVLPQNCDKGEAALHLVKSLGLSPGDVIVAGDSENDVDLFIKFRHGIIVGNAHEAMKRLLAGRDFYEAKSAAAAGLLEGLKFYGEKKIFKGG